MTKKKINNNMQSKKQKKDKNYQIKKSYQTATTDNDMSKLIKVILVILIVFAAFYLLTYGIQKIQENKKKNQERDVETNKIQYQEVLMSKILKQSSQDYYVLIIDGEDENSATYNTYINQIENTKIYTAQLDSAFNRKFKSDTSNLNVSNIDELKVKETTLLHVQNQVVVESMEGSSAVLEKIMTLY